MHIEGTKIKRNYKIGYKATIYIINCNFNGIFKIPSNEIDFANYHFQVLDVLFVNQECVIQI